MPEATRSRSLWTAPFPVLEDAGAGRGEDAESVLAGFRTRAGLPSEPAQVGAAQVGVAPSATLDEADS
jgi:hypothetical protein